MKTHGMFGTPEWYAWQAMLQRCTNPRSAKWADYGGRGVTVCQAWRDDFAAFYADMGPRPLGLTLDRRENDGNYEPGNCRWATPEQQVANRRPNRVRADSPHRIPGVRWRADREKFDVRIFARKRLHVLALTPDFFEACCIRKSAEARFHHPTT